MALRLGVQFLSKRVLFRSSPIIHSRTISLSTASRRNEVAHVIESTPGTILGINRLQLLYDDCYTASQIHRFTTGTLLQADNSISAEGIQSVEPARPSVLKEEYMYDEPLPDKSPFYAEMSEYPCAQGVQGNDEKQFAEWLESCRRFGLQNCQEQLQGVQSGRKSLSQVIAEQEELIRTIAEDHRVNARAQQGVQDDAADHLCPQGLQGEDHTKFTEWLQTCRQFGFGHCMDNIQGIQSGRKTLSQVMQEQDDLIQQVVRKKHTKAVPDQEKQRA